MAEKEYAYFSGCSLEGTAKEYDQSVHAVMKAFGIGLVEPKGWSCCGSSPTHTVSHVLASAVAARNLTLVKKMGKSMVNTPCPSCLTSFKEANHRMSNESVKNEVNALLNEPYNCDVEAKSTLQVIFEDIGLEAIAAKVKYVFPDLKIAPYYGCILNRPPKLAQFDDPENPVVMDKIMEALGLKVCDFAFKTECCGASFSIPKQKMVNELSYKVLDMAVDAGANCVVVACPLCQQNLDLRQSQINRRMKSKLNIPVLYFTQVMGLAFGLSPKELGFGKLVVRPDKLIKNKITKEEFEKK